MNVEDEITVQMRILIDELIASHNRLGMKASGEWIQSLESQVKGTSAKILGSRYTEQLVQGRAPGKMPPVSPLQDWARLKFGISEEEAQSVGWAIAKKIQKEGTSWYQDGGSDLLEVVFSDENLKKVTSSIAEVVTTRVSAELIRDLR